MDALLLAELPPPPPEWDCELLLEVVWFGEAELDEAELDEVELDVAPVADAPAVEAEEVREAATGFKTVMVEVVDEMLAICMASPRIEIHRLCIVHRRIRYGLEP